LDEQRVVELFEAVLVVKRHLLLALLSNRQVVAV
jgi:hypothetical protein